MWRGEKAEGSPRGSLAQVTIENAHGCAYSERIHTVSHGAGFLCRAPQEISLSLLLGISHYQQGKPDWIFPRLLKKK